MYNLFQENKKMTIKTHNELETLLNPSTATRHTSV